MPHLETGDLVEDLRVSRQNGKPVVSRKYHATGLVGGSVVERLAQALALTASGTPHTGIDLPEDGSTLVMTFGSDLWTLYANNFDVQPWSVDEAFINVTWDSKKRGNFDVAGFGPIIKEVGATVEEMETDFDYENLQKPLIERERIWVAYKPGAVTAPPPYEDPAVAAMAGWRYTDVRVRRWRGRPVLNFTRDQTVDPEPLARLFVAKTNLLTWRGYPPETVLCLSIIGRDVGTGIWNTHYAFAQDDFGFKQYARYIVPETGQAPTLTVPQLAVGNGIREITVQGKENFAALMIPP